jgi:nicotinamidase-related amidase
MVIKKLSENMKRALLIIDVQNEYFTGKLPIKYPENSFNNILIAMNIAKLQKIPIVLIQHTNPSDASTFANGSDGWKIQSQIASKHHDKLIEKTLPGSFTETNLEDCLKQHSIDTITIAGYMTQMCCDTTARQAFDLGFNVEFLSDATGTLDVFNYAGYVSAEELHRSILITQAMKFSKVLKVDEWIKTLNNNY